MCKINWIRLFEACGHNKLCPYSGCFLISNSRYESFVINVSSFIFGCNALVVSLLNDERCCLQSFIIFHAVAWRWRIVTDDSRNCHHVTCWYPRKYARKWQMKDKMLKNILWAIVSWIYTNRTSVAAVLAYENEKGVNMKLTPCCCWDTRIRTRNDRTRICSVTITPYPNKLCSSIYCCFACAKVRIFFEPTTFFPTFF